MSSVVHIITYIKLPMAKAYVTFAMKSLSSYAHGQCLIRQLEMIC